jgi:olefin beta-lactone synthetase
MTAGREPVNVAAHLALAAQNQPNQTAILPTKEGAFPARSFAELEKDVAAYSRFLRKCGIRPQDKVLVMVRPGYELIVSVFALFLLGACPVVIDPGMGMRNFLRCVKGTKPDALIGVPLAVFFARLFRGTFSGVRKKIVVRRNRFIRQLRDYQSSEPFHATEVNENDLAAILFTSGSTGPPKGVCYDHGTFAAQVQMLKKNFGIKPGEQDLVTLPVFALFNPALGMTSVIPEMDPRKPAQANAGKLVAAMRKHKITSVFGSPVLWRKIADHCKAHNIELPDIRRIFLAGAAAPPALVHKLIPILPNARIIAPYGATEALPLSVADANDILNTRESTEQGEGSCLGKPLPNIEFRILPVCNSPIPNLNEVKELREGEVGEIAVAGPVVTRTYYRMPGATVDSKVFDGKRIFHRMGDLGYFDRKGYLRFLGRKAECVITSNGPLETERCEPIVNTLDEVRRSALIGLGEDREKEPALVVEPEPNHFPQTIADKKRLAKKILETIHEHERLRLIRIIFFERSLPVDTRHNAKIHRLSLARKGAIRAKVEKAQAYLP